MSLPTPARRVAVEALRLPGRTLPVPGWFPLVVDRVHPALAEPGERPLTAVFGANMRLDIDEYVQRRIFYRCHEVPEARFVRRLLRPGDHVLDVGANVGFFTLIAAARVGPGGRVAAVEPIPHNVGVLKENLRLNGFGQVTVTQAAAGDHAGEIRLGLDHPDPRETGVSGHYTEGGARDALTVPLVTVDELLRGRPRLRLAKIDVEGSEPRVLAGMAETLAADPPDALLMEINPRALARQDSGVDDLVGPLRAAGYELRSITPTGRLGGPVDPRGHAAPTPPARGGALNLVWRGLRGLDRLESVAAVRAGAGR